jgi:putative two-component system response regulator
MEALRARLKAKTKAGELSCSFGLAMYPSDAKNYQELYGKADIALYAAKKNRDCAAVFSEIGENAVGTDHRALTEIDSGGAVLKSDTAKNIEARLQSCGDIPSEINAIIGEIGQTYDVNRVYIFELTEDGKTAVNTFEWCSDGIAPEKDNLQKLPADILAPYYKKLFDSDGLFNCYNINSLSPELYAMVEPQGIKSMLQYVLGKEGKNFGMIGFDECREYRYWNGRQIKVLSECAVLLGRALYDYRCVHGRDFAALADKNTVEKQE